MQMRPRYAAVVVGTGYGGGVAASRLARAGQRVCVLERGREIRIGEFPDRLSELKRDFQVTGKSVRFGSPVALFDYRLGDDIDVLLGCGLGGTSLINANVCLRPDVRIFDDPVWPEEIRSDGLLAEGYSRARCMLAPMSYPNQVPLMKLRAMEKSARRLGTELRLPPLHIAFERQINAANVEQPACTLCGDCCGGCNVGAKTTVQLTYVADASQHGAEIFTECTVRSVRRADNGEWEVALLPTDGIVDNDQTARMVRAPIVVLAAGTLGTTEILLRSRESGLWLSEQLGQHFTGNGDALAVGYNCDEEVNNVGVGHPPKVHCEPVGPAVAGLIDLRATDDPDDGIAIVESALPSAMSSLLPATFAGGQLPFGEDQDTGLRDELNEFGRALASLARGAYSGAVRNSVTYLGIGHDNRSGILTLINDRVSISWPRAYDQSVFARIDNAFRTAIAALGGSLLKNPLALPRFGGKVTSVHPLGGCVMAEDRRRGVINHKCQVYNGAGDVPETAVHDGLYVCDGSALPRSVGIHPLLTITAVAERAMIHMARDYRWDLDVAPTQRPSPIRITPVAPKTRKPAISARIRDVFGLAPSS